MAPVLILLIIDIDDVLKQNRTGIVVLQSFILLKKEKCEPETSHISFNATLPESPKGFHL
ncbi:hypothetical protein T01_7423 [Trichinella spiralis]|uniref:Uncharacterized protein n=1 Tax=Trichinella spiralis TaxID=6334 RepID=A0A0V0Z1L0_TRISP|nr:hypothetical protein T01_7423 [Trichinella spiralis]